MKLSILIPVYNERTIVEHSLRLVLAAPLPEHMERELVIVDDCSTDGTRDLLQPFAEQYPDVIRLLFHPVNRGKGAAIRTAIEHASGDFCLVQDADLEYDPNEYPRLLKPLLDGRADAVFGSRYLVSEQTRALAWRHTMLNKGLTLLSNFFSNLNLTDMETCYKCFRTELLKSIPIRSDRFGFEPEITMKVAKRRLRVYEVPISYHGRTVEEGKKIGWKDGFQALSTMLRFWLIDDLYTEAYGRRLLNHLEATPSYLSWITQLVRPSLGNTVLEVGANNGHFSGRLMAKRSRYVAADRDPLYLHALQNRFLRAPSVEVMDLDPREAGQMRGLHGQFDTVLALNLLEYVDDPRQVVENLAACLTPGGRLVLLVPHAPQLHSSLDDALGHRRRFRREDLAALAQAAGLQVSETRTFNRAGGAAWMLYGKLLQRRTVNKLSRKLFDTFVGLWRALDPVLPSPGLSLLLVATRPGTAPLSGSATPDRAVLDAPVRRS